MELKYLSSTLFLFAFFLISFFFFLARLYKRCPSNKILVVYGKVGLQKTVQCYHGGGVFVWPVIQAYAFLDLTPRTIHIPLKSALSQQNIRINVPSTFTVAIGTTPEVMNNAAIRLLDLDQRGIELMATEIIIGQLRLTVASLRIEEINQDRERFLEAIKKHIELELFKIGLTLLNVNITDITDESEYIESIGKKASATAVNQARIDVSEQEKQGAIGKALAERDQRISVASLNAEAVKGENDSRASIALTNATLAEKEAEALRRAEIAKQQAQAEIQKARSFAQTELLHTNEIVPQEINKQKIQIEAEAEAARRVIAARGEAEAILAIKEAEANGLAKILEAKSIGYQKLVQACGNDSKSASTMLLVEKLEKMVELQVAALQSIKIDKITVWDSGNKQGAEGSSTSHFLSQFVKSLPALHDIAALAGLELPRYLGKVEETSSSHPSSIEEEMATLSENRN